MAHLEDPATEPVVTVLLATPVKGFRVVEQDRLVLDANGAVGDRDFFVLDASARLLSVTRTGVFAPWTADFDAASEVLTCTSSDGRVLAAPVVPGTAVTVDFWESRDVAGHVVEGPWSHWLSEIAGHPVTLVRADVPGAGFDETPVTAVSQETLDALARGTGTPRIDVRRFRMSLTISGVEPYEEERWQGRTARVGTAVLRFRGPVPRCAAINRNPESGRRDLPGLRLLSQTRGVQPNDFGRGLNLGVYVEVVEPGTVEVGDRVRLL